MIFFAIQSIKEIHKIITKSKHKFSVKCGIDYGEVCAAFIGKITYQIDIFGNTVNKASRVCQLCKNLCIHCSSETHISKELENYYLITNIEEKKDVLLKGIGTVYTKMLTINKKN
jgi:class 3 adenylate cyclase